MGRPDAISMFYLRLKCAAACLIMATLMLAVVISDDYWVVAAQVGAENVSVCAFPDILGWKRFHASGLIS